MLGYMSAWSDIEWLICKTCKTCLRICFFYYYFIGDSPVRLGGSERVRTFRLPVLADETTNSTENPGNFSYFWYIFLCSYLVYIIKFMFYQAAFKFLKMYPHLQWWKSFADLFLLFITFTKSPFACLFRFYHYFP